MGSHFSEDYGFAPKVEMKPDDYLPSYIREAIISAIRRYFNDNPETPSASIDIYAFFRPFISEVVRRTVPQTPMNGPWFYYIPHTLLNCEWWKLFDILQELTVLIKRQWGDDHQKSFNGSINAVLAREGIVWTLNGDKVERVFSGQTQEQIQQAFILLKNPIYKGPDEQYAKALSFLNKRPEPDEENCVKDAVGALEGVVNILASETGKQLNHLLNQEPFKSSLHPIIKQIVEKLYAYRGSVPGVSHSLIDKPIVDIHEAEWVLVAVAATIKLFISKFE